MQFSMAYLNNGNQFVVRQFGNGPSSSVQAISIDQLDTTPLNGLFFCSEIFEDQKNGDIQSILSDSLKYFPVRLAHEFQLTESHFENLNQDEAKKIFSKANSQWLLGNNITLLGQLFDVLEHLAALWPNDRTSFFEELWFIVKTNLGASELTLIYNDLLKKKKDGEKDQLVQVQVKGERLPAMLPGGEFEKKLMDSYKNDLLRPFGSVEYNSQSGELVITGSIRQSPYIIMAKVFEYSSLQESLLKALFQGLSKIS